MRSLGGHLAAVAMLAIVGSRRENHCNIVEVLFKFKSKRLVIDGCRRVGSRSILGRKPFCAYLMADVMVMTKSGAARWLG